MKNLKNLGKTLNKNEQQKIYGGTNRLTLYTEPCDDAGHPCGGGSSGGGISNPWDCNTDADCENMRVTDEENGGWDIVNGTCTQVSGSGAGICVA